MVFLTKNSNLVVYPSIYDQLQGLHIVAIVTYEYHAYIFDVLRSFDVCGDL